MTDEAAESTDAAENQQLRARIEQLEWQVSLHAAEKRKWIETLDRETREKMELRRQLKAPASKLETVPQVVAAGKKLAEQVIQFVALYPPEKLAENSMPARRLREVQEAARAFLEHAVDPKPKDQAPLKSPGGT